MSTVAQVIVEALVANGIDRVFCVPGESYLPVLDALFDQNSIDVVTCRHEGSAGYMALTDARLTGRVGVCMVSRGPGAMNAAIAIHTAEQDCLPLLVLIGQVPRKNLRRGAFQEIDYSKMFVDLAKWTAEVTDPGRISEVLARAFQAALGGTPGPVIISLPEDLLEDLTECAVPPPYQPPTMSPSMESVDELARMIRSSRRPILLAGGRLATDDGRAALLAASQRWRIPIVVSFRRQDLFPNDHELYAGDLGLAVTDAQLQAFQNSDLLIAVGLRFDDLTTQGFTFPDMPKARQKLVHVHDDQKYIGTHCYPDLAVLCDPVSMLSQLATRSPGDAATDSGWISRLREMQIAKSTWITTTSSDGVVFGNLVAQLPGYLSDDAIVVADAGLSAAMLYQYIQFRPPQLLLATFAATMGCGVANAISAAMRFPQRQVVCVAGDGGFIMSATELGLAVDRKLPIRFVVSNNASYGSIRRDQEKAFPHRVIATNLSNPDFGAFVRSFGCEAFVIDREQQIDQVMSEAFHVDGPALIEIKSSLMIALPKSRTAAVESAHAG
jgi:acetolactate synthase I/II/III large subunit